MSHEGFPLRHRGVHLPDYIRRLDEIAIGKTSPRTRQYGRSGRTLVPSRRELIIQTNEPPLAAFFRNMTVWIDQLLSGATAHAGYDKIHMYMVFLRAFVDDVVPHPELQRVVANLEAYVSYLSVEVEAHNHLQRPNQPLPPSPVVSSRTAALSKGVLSPRVLRAMSKDVAPDAALQSPRIIEKRPKKIIELSDHEEAILEIAVFYEEVLVQLSTTGKTKQPSIMRSTPSLTQQWLLFSTTKRTKILKTFKTKITNQTLFPCAPGLSKVPGTPSGAGARGNTQIQSAPTIQTIDLPSYYSLVTLCLQEVTRRIGVFSAESATFLWTVIIRETQDAIERMLQSVLARQQRAHDAVEQLKRSRSDVHDAIAHCEREIQRLQAQNVRSLAVWDLEKAEITMLEHEEAWHGHCKALIVKSLVALRDEANQATWFQIGSSSVDGDKEDEDKSETLEPASVHYHRLPVGAALLHSRLRARVVYVTHLIVLCRSFLHLHEKRGLREVMETTTTHPPQSDSPSSFHVLQPTASDMMDTHAMSPSTSSYTHIGAMERISTNELLTLKDINDALRAIEELYACTGGSGDHSNTTQMPQPLRGNDVGTQFPLVGITDPPDDTGFVRALAFSTLAAGNPRSELAFVRAGSRNGRRNGQLVVAHPPPGSGRRSTLYVDNDPTTPTQPMIRLNKALANLPLHCRKVLILPLLDPNPFPADAATSIVESLSVDEILVRIQWIYALVMDATMPPTGRQEVLSGPPIPLGRYVWQGWNTEQFVAFIHTAFLDKFNKDVAIGEADFVRFIASIQLLFSGLAGSTSGTGASHTMDKIRFFTRLTQIVHLDAPDSILKHHLPAQVFPVFFYSMYVLQQVAVTKKHVDEAGLTIEVWTVPVIRESGSPTRPRISKPPTPQPPFRVDGIHASSFVLLESVKTVLLYLLDATSPDASVVINDRIQYLTERASLAKVALINPIIPGAYDSNTGQSQSPMMTSSSPSVVNGEVTDALIIPLEFVVLTIASTWLQQHQALVDRLSVAMRAACHVSSSGELSYDEFTHVMLVGAAAPPTAAASTLRSGQLTQIFASQLAASTSTSPRGGVPWQDLLVAATDEIDLLGLNERFQLFDLRSIQHAVLRGVTRTGNYASPWVLKPSYRGGDTVTLQRAWDANQETMREHFGLAFQSENTLEGLWLWQTGNVRISRVEKLLQSPRHGDTTEVEIMTADDLAVAWRALYYLQLDHTQAHHVADHVRAKLLGRSHIQRPPGH